MEAHPDEVLAATEGHTGVTDMEKLRTQLRVLSRGDLLIIAERATELMSDADLKAILGDCLDIDTLEARGSRPAPSIEDVRRFCNESRDGRYFESFDTNGKHLMARSKGTDAFIAEFDRLLRQCIRAVDAGQHSSARQAFELLFGLLRRIDEAHDDVVFFADEAGSWQVGINWRRVFPAYFRCLAETTSAEEFAGTVDQVIRTFVEYERPWHLSMAQAAATAAQQAALRTLCGTDK